MGLYVIVAWSLGATFGNQSRFIFDNPASLVPLLREYEFVANGNYVGWLLYKLSSAHAFELVKLCINGLFPFWPFRGLFRFTETMTLIRVVRDSGKCLRSNICNAGFLFV